MREKKDTGYTVIQALITWVITVLNDDTLKALNEFISAEDKKSIMTRLLMR